MTLKEKFQKYDRENPKVWEYFQYFAKQLIQNGQSKISAALIVERIRWEVIMLNTKSDDQFKISNNHTAFYARKFMEAYPEFDGCFYTRTQAA